MPIARCDESEITTALGELAAWRRESDSIVRSIVCRSFADAIALIVRVGFLAEAADHHPDIDLRWKTVTVSLSTHECDGLSRRDFALAAQIDVAAVAFAVDGAA